MSKADFIAPLYPRFRWSSSVAKARRLALPLLVALAACDSPPQAKAPEPPKAQERRLADPSTKQQLNARAEQCGKTSREQFQRAWKDGGENGADGKVTAEFTNHYNAKLDTCFYLLTVASTGTIRKMLFDVNGGELYGEFLGPAIIESPLAGKPKTCRVESLYCASGGEWEVLIKQYMEE